MHATFQQRYLISRERRIPYFKRLKRRWKCPSTTWSLEWAGRYTDNVCCGTLFLALMKCGFTFRTKKREFLAYINEEETYFFHERRWWSDLGWEKETCIRCLAGRLAALLCLNIGYKEASMLPQSNQMYLLTRNHCPSQWRKNISGLGSKDGLGTLWVEHEVSRKVYILVLRRQCTFYILIKSEGIWPVCCIWSWIPCSSVFGGQGCLQHVWRRGVDFNRFSTISTLYRITRSVKTRWPSRMAVTWISNVWRAPEK